MRTTAAAPGLASAPSQAPDPAAILDPAGLDALLAALRSDGYRVIGPTRRDHAIVYDDIASLADLPAGWGDEQAGGHYRLKRREDAALFGYAVGPHSWKRYLHAPRQALWRKPPGEAAPEPAPLPEDKLAFLGVRGCELAAIAVQDRVLRDGAHPDPYYAARRAGAFLVAVNCGTAAATCFCASMASGPAAGPGHDLALTELLDDQGHRFLATPGSARGAALLARLPRRPATAAEAAAAAALLARTAAGMRRGLPDAAALPALLRETLEHPRWAETAERCLACGNCTMACPTCFCTSTLDSTDLAGGAAREQRWASCFELDHSYLHGGAVRASARARYRQWLTHKLGTWVEQFGSSGCTGCGRCITWCPVGIDLTEEIAALREPAP